MNCKLFAKDIADFAANMSSCELSLSVYSSPMSAFSQASPPSPGSPPKTAEDEEAKPGALLDPADANAIQEVNLAYENVKEVDGLDVSKDGSEAWEAAIKRLGSMIL